MKLLMPLQNFVLIVVVSCIIIVTSYRFPETFMCFNISLTAYEGAVFVFLNAGCYRRSGEEKLLHTGFIIVNSVLKHCLVWNIQIGL